MRVNAPLLPEDTLRELLQPALDSLMEDAIAAYFEVAPKDGHEAGMAAAYDVLGVEEK